MRLGPQHYARDRGQTKAQRVQDFNECKLGAMVVYPQGTVTSGRLLQQCMIVRGYSRKDCRRCSDE